MDELVKSNTFDIIYVKLNIKKYKVNNAKISL